MLESVSNSHYRLRGHIDMQESSVLLRELMALPTTASGTQALVLDVSGLDSADSLLLAALLDLQRKLVLRGCSLKVRGLSASMRGLARVYGIETLLESLLEA